MNKEKLRIAEIFASVQGEGTWLGMPSTFVRVSGCNLRCSWCDTPYASWRPEGPHMLVDEIVAQVESYGLRHVVLTGGEPMLFDGIATLAQSLRENGHYLTVETAGTVFRELPCDLMSISPKLGNSKPEGEWAIRHEKTRLDLEPLRKLVGHYPYQLKFVVNPEEGDRDLREIDEILARLPRRAEAVFLMPEGTDSETLRRRARIIVGWCIPRGWRIAPRLHIDLFGNERGT